MPEGHVIHRLARTLNDGFRGGPVAVSSPQGRFARAASLLDGHRIRLAEAYGKHLFIHFEDTVGPEATVYIHLGLIGQLRFEPVDTQKGQIRLRIVDPTSTCAAHLRGPQFCRLIDREEFQTILARTGPDPLRDDADVASLTTAVRSSRRSIGTLLMDQKLFAGVGNIYRAEALFRQGISPFIPGKDLSEQEVRGIWDDLVELMAKGVEEGEINTVRSEHLPDRMGRKPRVDDHGGEVYVYRRAGLECYVCGHLISEQVLQGRNLFWCRHCQPER